MCKYLLVLISWAALSVNVLSQERQLQCSHFYIPYTEAPSEAISVAISPNGGLVTCADKSKLIEIRDTQSGSLFASLTESNARFEVVQFSPDGTTLVIGMSDGTIRHWSLENQQKQISKKLHDAPVIGLRYSPDGRRIASIAKNDVTIIQDAKTGSELKRFQGNAASIAWSNDSQTLLIGGVDEIQMVAVDSGEIVIALEGADGAIGATTLSISPDGRYAAAGHPGEDFATVWEIPSGKVRAKLVGHEDEITTISFDVEAKTICTTSLDGTVRNWDASSGKQVNTKSGISPILSRASSNTSNLSITGGKNGELLIWNADRIQGVLRSHKGDVGGLEFSPDGTQLSASVRIRSQDEFISRVTWPVDKGSITTEKLTNKSLQFVQEQVVSKDSMLRARRNGTAMGISHRTNSQWSDDVVIQSQHYEFLGMQFIQGSNSLVAANHSRLLRFDCANGKETLAYETPLKYISHFAGSPSGKSAVIVSDRCEIELYSFADESAKWQREIKILASGLNPFRANYVDGINFLSEDHLVLSADGALQIWSIGSAEVLHAQPVSNDMKITRVASSGNNSFVTISSHWKQGEEQQVMRHCTFDGKKVVTLASTKLWRDEIRKLEVTNSLVAFQDSRGAIISWSLSNESPEFNPAFAEKRKARLTEDEESKLGKLLKTLDDKDIGISTKLETIRSIGEMKEKAASAVDKLVIHLPSNFNLENLSRHDDSRDQVVAITEALKQIGEPSVPHLAQIIKHKNTIYAYYGLEALVYMNPNAKRCDKEIAEVIRDRMKKFPQNGNEYEAAFITEAIRGLKTMNIEPSIAVSLLAEIASIPSSKRHIYYGPSGEFSTLALSVMTEYGSDARPATPVLIKVVNESLVALNNNGSSFYREAIQTLGAIGPDAEEALPTLRAILKSDKQLPRNLAQDTEHAIRLIKAKIE
jgi:WD40 repeat protein